MKLDTYMSQYIRTVHEVCKSKDTRTKRFPRFVYSKENENTPLFIINIGCTARSQGSQRYLWLPAWPYDGFGENLFEIAKHPSKVCSLMSMLVCFETAIVGQVPVNFV